MASLFLIVLAISLLVWFLSPIDSPAILRAERAAKQYDKDLQARADHLADRKIELLRKRGLKPLPRDHIAYSREIHERLKARGNPYRSPGGALYA